MRPARELTGATNAVARRRALLGLELAGRGGELALALAAARSADTRRARPERSPTWARVHRRRHRQRDERCVAQLHRLLERAEDWTATSIVRVMASAERREVLVTLATELSRSPRFEPLLLSAIPSAARGLPPPHEPRRLEEVRERLGSTGPLIARAAAGAVAALEDCEALPALIVLLDSADPGLRGTALDALRQISRCTYGPEPLAWTAWLEREREWYARGKPASATDAKQFGLRQIIRARIGTVLSPLKGTKTDTNCTKVCECAADADCLLASVSAGSLAGEMKRNLRWFVTLSAVVLGYLMVLPCGAEAKPLRATAYDPGFDEADCSYHSITLGSDGRVYFSMSGHRIDQNAGFGCFDPSLGGMVFTRDIGEGLKGEDTTRTVPQGKIPLWTTAAGW